MGSEFVFRAIACGNSHLCRFESAISSPVYCANNVKMSENTIEKNAKGPKRVTNPDQIAHYY